MGRKPASPHPTLVEQGIAPRTVLAWVNCPDCGAYCDEKTNVNALVFTWCSRCYAKHQDPRPKSTRKIKAFVANGKEPLDHYSAKRDDELFAKFRADDDTPKPKEKRYGTF